MAAIRLDGLTKRYGDHVAIDDLDLTVPEGDAFGFLGPNGAGKSTTIDILLDYVRPSEGTATVLGCDAQRDAREIHERIGVLPEGYDLYDRLTGYEHLRLPADLKGINVDADRVLDRIGLSDVDADRPVGTYSTGMCQRLALGMATVGDPELLVLDEPTSGLDPHGISLLKQLITEEVTRGTTVFLSSHGLEHVAATCDRVGIIEDGQLMTVAVIDDHDVSLAALFDRHTSTSLPERENPQSVSGGL
ncbi:ABC transporter ATP-binding protein [Halalkalicoccus tibetensis]|uniref:ABC transporter ATP-binding protein n=1 Tax=Halalkalicoccus tibetensis TaxID=175632 RepID=A0ABD5V7Q7_9EURY